ncbi:amidase signature domain-containing protein [Ilyonectria sp. MPI-CAGE-AT-0026]|nr:amidase signature domain-containing protein [Ilyonectria sp. MPI-CAGE-AT-0026]
MFKIEETAFLARRLLHQSRILDPAITGLCTVLRPPTLVSSEWLQDKVEKWNQDDDVFQSSFTANVVFIREKQDPVTEISPDSLQVLQEWQSNVVLTTVDSQRLSEGPYYVQSGVIHTVWRLFSDTHEAFMTATIPRNEAFHEYRNLPCSNGCRLMIGAPSKLYTPKSEKKPLDGLRISVKDNIDLAGIKTTLSCRSCERLYPPKDTTAAAVQRLLDLGAIVVGKTKLSQFAEVESPTADWVDFHCPFNPRGDGYLTPEGSTTGGAVSLAAYDWLDVSIGTDTGGSLREPASKQGLFALRPSWDALPMEGVFPLAVALDTIGFLCRDVDVLHEVAAAWLGDNNEPNISVSLRDLTKITVLSDFEYGLGLAKRVFDNFVSRLEEATHVQSTMISLIDNWKQKSPSCDGKAAQQQTIKAIKAFDLWKNTQRFRDEYQQKFGKRPYVNPTIRLRWYHPPLESTADGQKAALKRKEIFKKWFLESVLSVEAPNELTTITVAPISDEEPKYRDVYKQGPWMGGNGFHCNFLSPLTGCPEVVVPIDQIPYQSRVTKRQEFLPIVVAILGPPDNILHIQRKLANSS